MKKFSLFTLFAFAMSFVACLFAGCSDTTAMGTSEEGNEFAEYVSSSSEESSSSVQSSSRKVKFFGKVVEFFHGQRTGNV